MSKPATAQRGGGGLVWLQGLAIGAMVAMVPAAALLLGVLLAPGLAALMLDRRPGRPVARSVLLCGAAGCVAPVGDLWNAGQTVDASLAVLGELGGIGTAWSAAAAGWLLAELIPVVVRVVLEAASLAHAVRLRAARAKLAEEWEPDPPPD
jgi:hypothetical protein